MTKKDLDGLDESKAIYEYFKPLYPVDWKESIKPINPSIIEKISTLMKSQRKKTLYGIFIGLILLAAV